MTDQPKRAAAAGRKCKRCGTLILFIKSASTGKPHPVDAKPIQGFTESGEIVSVRVSHFATCSHAAEFRSRGGQSHPNPQGALSFFPNGRPGQGGGSQ